SPFVLLIDSESYQTKAILPGKLIEYMVSCRPILAIANDASDIRDIIVSTNTGVFFDYSEKDRLRESILNYYRQYKENNLTSHPIGLQQYSRKNLTKKLSEIL